MTQASEVIVLNPRYWVDHALQLSHVLGGSRVPSPVGDPTGQAPDPETMLTISDAGYWSAQPRELQEVLNLASGGASERAGDAGFGSGAVPASQERLTLTVEEAAAALGISRAFAYESVRRGDIPHIKIGRRILVPKAKLEQMLSSAGRFDTEGAESDS